MTSLVKKGICPFYMLGNMYEAVSFWTGLLSIISILENRFQNDELIRSLESSDLTFWSERDSDLTKTQSQTGIYNRVGQLWQYLP